MSRENPHPSIFFHRRHSAVKSLTHNMNYKARKGHKGTFQRLIVN